MREKYRPAGGTNTNTYSFFFITACEDSSSKVLPFARRVSPQAGLARGRAFVRSNRRTRFRIQTVAPRARAILFEGLDGTRHASFVLFARGEATSFGARGTARNHRRGPSRTAPPRGVGGVSGASRGRRGRRGAAHVVIARRDDVASEREGRVRGGAFRSVVPSRLLVGPGGAAPSRARTSRARSSASSARTMDVQQDQPPEGGVPRVPRRVREERARARPPRSRISPRARARWPCARQGQHRGPGAAALRLSPAARSPGTPAWDPDAPRRNSSAGAETAEDAFEAFPTASTSTSSSPAAAAAVTCPRRLSLGASSPARHLGVRVPMRVEFGRPAARAGRRRRPPRGGDERVPASRRIATRRRRRAADDLRLRAETRRQGRRAARPAQTINESSSARKRAARGGLSPPTPRRRRAAERRDKFSETRFSEPTPGGRRRERRGGARGRVGVRRPERSTSNGLRTGSSIAPNTSGPASDALLVLYSCAARRRGWSGGGGAQARPSAATRTAAMDLIRRLLEGPSAPRWLAALRDRLAAPLCVAILRGARGAEDFGTSSARETALALGAREEGGPQARRRRWFHLGRKPKPKAGSRGSSHSKTEGLLLVRGLRLRLRLRARRRGRRRRTSRAGLGALAPRAPSEGEL